MSDEKRLTAGLAAYVLALGCVVVVFSDCGVAAQAAPSRSTLLGRTFVREAGVRAYSRDDGPAIHAVISFRSEHVYHSDYTEGLLRATCRAPYRLDLPRPWIIELGPELRGEPGRWNPRLSWPRNEVHIERTFAHARDTLRGDVVHRCRVPGSIDDVWATPHAWGNFYDAQRFRRRNPTAVELDCGNTCSTTRTGTVRLDRNGNPKCNYFFQVARYARYDT